MSTVAAETDESVAGDVAPAKGKKKLIIIVAAALLVTVLGGGATAFVLKKRAAAAAAAAEAGAEEDDGAAEAVAVMEEKRKQHAKHPPTFVPLDPFVVNLADKESDRFAQIGITLEIDDAKFADELRSYMPAIRNGILMVLAHKTFEQLLRREGKLVLAREIMREAVLPMGIVVGTDAPEPQAKAKDGDKDDEDDTASKPKKSGMHNPVTHVHFSNFIVQ